MDFKQNQKINQVTEQTLVIGIDIAKRTHFAYFLDDVGIPLVMTNPMHVKRSKELDDNLPTKNDCKDAFVIARLLKDDDLAIHFF
jgi:transposase